MAQKQKKTLDEVTTIPNKKQLPMALARRAEQLVRAKKKRLLAEAHELIALVQRRKKQVTELFYEMGEALKRLKEKEMLLALGYASFDRLCDEKLQISTEVANRLIDVVTRISRKDALAMGQAKAFALVDLAEATPADDTPAGLLRGKTLALPGGETLDLKKASGRAILRGAKAIRNAQHAGKPRRGRTTTAEERARAARLQAELHERDLRDAKVTALATKPGAVASFRIERIPADRLAVLAKAIGAALKRSNAR